MLRDFCFSNSDSWSGLGDLRTKFGETDLSSIESARLLTDADLVCVNKVFDVLF